MASATILCPVSSSDIELPFFSARVPAGFPSPAQDHLEQTLSLDELLEIDAPHTYLVRVDGESMIGVGIFDGDVLVVSKALQASSGDIVVASINGDTCVKRFSMDGKLIVLRSENPTFAPRFIMEGDELRIWGVVTASIRRHRCHA